MQIPPTAYDPYWWFVLMLCTNGLPTCTLVLCSGETMTLMFVLLLVPSNISPLVPSRSASFWCTDNCWLEPLDAGPQSGPFEVQGPEESLLRAWEVSFCFCLLVFPNRCIRVSISTFNGPPPGKLALLGKALTSTFANMKALSTIGFAVGVGVTRRFCLKTESIIILIGKLYKQHTSCYH